MTRQALPEPLHRCKRPRPAIPCESSPIAAVSTSSPSGRATLTNTARRRPAPPHRRTAASPHRLAGPQDRGTAAFTHGSLAARRGLVARRPAVIRSAPDLALVTQPAPYPPRTGARARRSAARSLASVFSAGSRSAAVLSTTMLACATKRGKGWDLAAPAPAPPAVSLLLLGEAGFPGRTAKLVAAEVERTLAARRSAGVPVVLLWLGDAIGDACPRRPPGAARASPSSPSSRAPTSARAAAASRCSASTSGAAARPS